MIQVKVRDEERIDSAPVKIIDKRQCRETCVGWMNCRAC